jgi:hypothetical protein
MGLCNTLSSYKTGLRRMVVYLAPHLVFVVLSIALLAIPQSPAQAQDGTTFDATRFEQLKPNKYRGGVENFAEVKKNMEELFVKLLHKSGPEIDKYYSPHLRDIVLGTATRVLHALIRVNAGTRKVFWGTCVGACPGCLWHGDYDEACCNGKNWMYATLVADQGWKTCCVRNGEENWSEEKIACSHPAGDGWAGLFEYYYPATVIGWENDRTTTMIVEKDKVQKCVEASDPLMEGDQAVDWVAGAIDANARALGEKPNKDEITRNVKEYIKEIRPKDKSLRFGDGLQGEGLTVRVNFATMGTNSLPVSGQTGVLLNERQRLAASLCMHPDQFMKIMHPVEDPYQKIPAGALNPGGLLQNLPVFGNYCPNGVNLMTNPFESALLRPVDGTPTDLAKGFLEGYITAGPLYCQAMRAAAEDTRYSPEQRQAILQTGTKVLDEKAVGYSCRKSDQGWAGLSPVMLYRTAQIERRAPEHALAFLIAAGLHEHDTQDSKKSYYKRFEPMPYSQQANIFSGKAFKGGSGLTERPLPWLRWCDRTINGADYQGKNMPDQLYISDKTNKFTEQGGFIQEPIHEWNKLYTEWTKDKKTPQRGMDKMSQNYGSAFRIFATCPLGYQRWRGAHSGDANKVCGEEKLW